MYDLDAIKDHFPLPSFRSGQEAAIKFALDQFNKGKKFVIIEAPTGSGKTALGMTIASYNDSNYYLTSSKILQDQLQGDFSDKLVTLKGRTAYTCDLMDRMPDREIKNLINLALADEFMDRRSCSDGICRSKASNLIGSQKNRSNLCFHKENIFNYSGTAKSLNGKEYSLCEYYEAIGQAIHAKVAAMNFSAFLTQVNYTQRFSKRQMLIVDEGHNLERELLDFVNFNIECTLLEDLVGEIPNYNNVKQYLEYFRRVNLMDVLEDAASQAEASSNNDMADNLQRLLHKLGYMLSAANGREDEWVVEFKEDMKRNHTLSFKPIFVRDQAHQFVFGHAERVLIMSATILDVGVFCDSLGIEEDDCAAYRMKNRFPKENRPIVYDPVARFTGGKDKAQMWLPLMAERIDELMDKHENHRGIIHTHNFMIMDYLVNNLKNSHRLIHQKQFNSKNAMLEELQSSNNGVIIAPAMHEGLNLHGDLSRFQIICKMPFPNFYDDKQLGRRVEIDKRYLNWVTALKLIQSYGRSIRSETDYATTYILDATFDQLLKNCGSMIPKWFTEAII